MREIKFRVWNVQFSKMSETFDLEDFGEDQDSEHGPCEFSLRTFTIPEKKNILMQYTGLKDKNGKEIYEGDIVKRADFSDGVIVWHNDLNGYILGGYRKKSNERDVDLKTFQTKDIEVLRFFGEEDEVIGNVYENPELLEEI